MEIDIIDLLKKERNHKNATFALIANQILSYDEYSHLSIKKLAEDCHISNTTVIRFCNDLDIQSFSELKYLLKNVEFRNKDIKIQANLSLSKQTDEHLDSIKTSLASTRAIIRESDLNLVVDLLLNSERVNIYGVGSTYLICQDLEIKLERLRIFAKSYGDQNLQFFAAKNSDANTLSIGITYSGKTESVLKSLQHAKEKGSKTILITSFDNKHLEKQNDITFFVISKDSRFRHITTEARLVMLYITDLILNSLMNHDLELTNKILEESKIYNNKS